MVYKSVVFESMNKELIKKRRKEYRLRNKDNIRLQRKKYYENNREQILRKQVELYKSVDRKNERKEQRDRHKTLNRKLILHMFGGKCEHCGISCWPPNEHELDHIDPNTKKFSISNRIHYRFINIINELQKCQMLCKPCHKTKTLKNKEYGSGKTILRGMKNGNSKLTTEQVKEVIDNPDINNSEFGRRFGVDNSTISNIRCGRTWTIKG